MRMTKIICTLGPATDSEEILTAMVREGMNVARINFSHGNHEEHQKRVDLLKSIREKLGEPVAIMLDTKGPDVRLGMVHDGKAELVAGDRVVLTTDTCEGTAERLSVSYRDLPKKLHAGDRVLINDGLIQLEVEQVKGCEITCRVKIGGMVSDHKGVNVPGVKLDIPYIRESDVEDILFAVKNDFDYIAASFVRSASDVLSIKRILEENGAAHIQIISKIENSEGIENVDEILKVSDGLMVARGDLGVEIDFEELPHLQKMMIKKVLEAGKKSVTATQMLESMIYNPRPTRAETSDVANAVYDGTSAVMLSGETSVGKYPVETLRAMCRIAERTEADIDYKELFRRRRHMGEPNITDAISNATVTTAHELEAAAIVTVTLSGTTARMISKYRPACPIIGCTSDERVLRQLALSWGVVPVLAEDMRDSDELFEHAVELAVGTGLVKRGEQVVITAGLPLGLSGNTNIVKVHIVGHVLVSGTGIGNDSSIGNACVCKTEDEALARFNPGDILVIPETSNRIMGLLKKAAAIITEKEGVTSHAAIVGLTLDIPVVCGAAYATEIIKHGTTVTVDSSRGLVYSGATKV